MTDASTLRIRTPKADKATAIPTPPMTRSETRAHLMSGLERWLIDDLVPIASDQMNNTVDARCLRRVAEWKGVDLTAAAHLVFAVCSEYLETGVYQQTPVDKLAVGFVTVSLQPFGRPIADLWKVSPFEKLRNAPPLPDDSESEGGDEDTEGGDEDAESGNEGGDEDTDGSSGNEDTEDAESGNEDTDSSNESSDSDNENAIGVKSAIRVGDMTFKAECRVHMVCIASLIVLVVAYLWSVAALVSANANGLRGYR